MAKSDDKKEKKKKRRRDDDAAAPPDADAKRKKKDKKKKRRETDAAEAQPETAAPTKKKKPRWRDQRALTLVVTQLSYEADADAVAGALSVDGAPADVRLRGDQAASANNRKHAGLAYAVYDTAGDAVAAASKTYSVNGRAVQIKPPTPTTTNRKAHGGGRRRRAPPTPRPSINISWRRAWMGCSTPASRRRCAAAATAWPAACVTWPRPLVETRSSRTPMLTRSACSGTRQ